jgi:hypothetical protein
VEKKQSFFCELADPSLLKKNNDDQKNRQERPNDHKDPDVDLFIGNSQYACPIDQDSNTPIEDLIHHFLPPFELTSIRF